MNSLAILAVKHSNINFKSDQKNTKTNNNYSSNLTNEHIYLGSATVPGSGLAILGKKKEAGLIGTGSLLSWGISVAGVVKVTKAVINKNKKTSSRIGQGVLGGLIVATGVLAQCAMRTISAQRTKKALIEKDNESLKAELATKKEEIPEKETAQKVVSVKEVETKPQKDEATE